jgi:hypothetical protein
MNLFLSYFPAANPKRKDSVPFINRLALNKVPMDIAFQPIWCKYKGKSIKSVP